MNVDKQEIIILDAAVIFIPIMNELHRRPKLERKKKRKKLHM